MHNIIFYRNRDQKNLILFKTYKFTLLHNDQLLNSYRLSTFFASKVNKEMFPKKKWNFLPLKTVYPDTC